MRILASLIFAATLLLGATNANAAPDAKLCSAKKNIAAGIYFKCIAKADAKFDINSSIGDRIRAKRRCSERLVKFYTRADSRFGANCATSADAAIIEGDLTAIGDMVTAWLRSAEGDKPIPPDVRCGPNTVFDNISRTCTGSPVTPPDTCGNGEIEATEECDFQAFGGVTCSDFGFDRGNLECASECRIDTSGCYNDGNPSGSNRFEVRDDDTVLDRLHNVLWEAKWDPHRTNVSIRDLKFKKGALDAVFLAVLNDTFSVFGNGENPRGGCSGWRLPTSSELSSIANSGMVSYQCGAPAELCLPRTHYVYWSSTAVGDDTLGIVLPTGMTRILPNSAEAHAIGVCDLP